MPSSSSYNRWWVWIVYLILFAIAIPWYWNLPSLPIDAKSIWFGFPAWVVVSVAGSFLISCFSAILWTCFWPEDDEEEDDLT